MFFDIIKDNLINNINILYNNSYIYFRNNYELINDRTLF